jgi:hypothetical protein
MAQTRGLPISHVVEVSNKKPDFESAVQIALDANRRDLAVQIVNDAILHFRENSVDDYLSDFYPRAIKLALQINDVEFARQLASSHENLCKEKASEDPEDIAPAFDCALQSARLIPENEDSVKRIANVAVNMFLEHSKKIMDSVSDIRSVHGAAFEFARTAGTLDTTVRSAMDYLSQYAIEVPNVAETRRAYHAIFEYADILEDPNLAKAAMMEGIEVCVNKAQFYMTSTVSPDHEYYFTAVDLADLIEDQDIKRTVILDGIEKLKPYELEQKIAAVELAYKLSTSFALVLCEELRFYEYAAVVAARDTPNDTSTADMYSKLHEALRSE